MKVLITGGAGFIGSHLAEHLLQAGMEVYALDDLSTGSLENVLHLMDRPGFHFVLGSIMDQATLEDLCRTCHYVYHLGAAVGVKLIVDRPVHTIETNVKGTENVLSGALRYGRKVLIASTSEVYGKDVSNGRARFVETDNVTFGPSLRWCYACSKALDEYLARAYHVDKGLPVVIARFFNTVGPRQTGTYGMVVPRFVSRALAGRPITIYGDGTQVRSFTWVGDAVSAVARLMDAPQAVGEVFNIGGDESVSIHELALRVKKMTGSPSEIVFLAYEEVYGRGFEDIRYRVPDISKLRRTIGYEPSMTLNDILAEVINYHRQRMLLPGAAGDGA